MAFDSSRFTFNAWNDFLGVVMQQGRVQTDADWNEWLTEFARRIQAGTMDTIGRAVYPATTPNAFKINAFTDATGQHLTIGAGRMYVDGLMVENHGPTPGTWDPALAELSGAPQPPPPSAAAMYLDYTAQPYLRLATLPTTGGPFLAYLDVWKRAVTYLEYPDLVDKAIGVDTTGRIQMVWQVKLLDLQGAPGITCDSTIQDWDNLIQPSGARLTTAVVQNADGGPCCLSPATGYTGQENQLYRVEIHQAGASSGNAPPVATFKWSNNNASVITGVTAITGATTSKLTVMSTGRDEVLSFKAGDWIEITDDYLELNGLPGELHRIATNGVSKALKTIALQDTVSSDFATRMGKGDFHTRICKWDQSGKVYQTDGVNLTEWFDLDAVNGPGDIPVPPVGTMLVLENGVTVQFSLDPAGGNFKTGDFWTFAARTADGSVEPLKNAPPMGIHHHYTRLSIVNFPTNASDCRTPWPPPTTAEGDCACTVCVDAADHNSGNFTITQAVKKIVSLGTGGRICLGPGIFLLGNAPVSLQNLEAVEFVGQGMATILAFAGTGPAVIAQGNFGLRIRDLSVLALASTPQGVEFFTAPVAMGILLRNSVETVIEDCAIFALAVTAPSRVTELQAQAVASVSATISTIAIGLDGFLVETQIRDNLLWADIGIGQLAQFAISTEQSRALAVLESREVLALANLDVTDNFLPCAQMGVALLGPGGQNQQPLNLFLLEIACRDNRVLGCAAYGIAIEGFTMPDATIRIADNHIDVPGIGIHCGADGAEIADNFVTQAMTATSGNAAASSSAAVSGITIVSIPGNELAIALVRILRNRIFSYAGPGITVGGNVLRSSIIGNSIEAVMSAGISVTVSSTLPPEVMIRDNEISAVVAPAAPAPARVLVVGPQAGPANLGQDVSLVAPAETALPVVIGIQVTSAATATIENNSVAFIGNTIRIRAIGISVATGAAAMILGNDITDIGPAEVESDGIGIYANQVAAVNVSNNTIRQTTSVSGNYMSFRGILISEKETKIEELTGEAVINANMVYGNSAALLDATSGHCVLNGNLFKQAASSGDDVVAVVTATTCIAGNNRILSAGKFLGMSITVPGTPESARATVVGNVTSIGIHLNGHPLIAPWAALNLIA